LRILSGIIQEPSNELLRKIKLENAMIQNDVTGLNYGIEMLVKLGFEEVTLEEKKQKISKY
jgi:hypothetical protein